MKVSEIMTDEPTYIPPSTSLKKAAEQMEKLNTGFLPIGDDQEDRLTGVITDRDIAIRGVSKGLDPDQVTVEEVKTDKVLYCYENDQAEDAAENMHKNQVYRLIVLNNPEEKRLSGVVTLGDVGRKESPKAAEKAAKGIIEKQQEAV